MAEILLNVIKISASVAIPLSSLALSLKVGRPYLKDILENKSILIRFIIAMFIIAPLIAVIYYFLFPEYRLLWIALLVISLSPPSSGIIKKISAHGISQNIGMILVITGILLSLIFIPLTLLILENLFKVDLDLGIDDVILKISMVFVIPCIIGFLISIYFEKYVKMILKIIEPVSKITMLIFILSLLILAIPLIIKNGIVPVLLVLLFQITLLIIIHFISKPEKSNAPVIPYSVILRLPAPAVVISQINGSLSRHIGTILLFTIMGAVIILLYNKFLQSKKVTI